MSLPPELLIAILSVVGTAWAAWLTYRASQVKSDRELLSAHITVMQEEIARLQRGVGEREEQVRSYYSEIKLLRGEIQVAAAEIHELKLRLIEGSANARILYNQLLTEGLRPLIAPEPFTLMTVLERNDHGNEDQPEA